MTFLVLFALVCHASQPRPSASFFVLGDGAPAGTSGVAHLSENKYLLASDRGGVLTAVELSFDTSRGRITALQTLWQGRLEGGRDIEGLCRAPSTQTEVPSSAAYFYAVDEADNSLLRFQFDLTSVTNGQIIATERISIPPAILAAYPNRGLESVACYATGSAHCILLSTETPLPSDTDANFLRLYQISPNKATTNENTFIRLNLTKPDKKNLRATPEPWAGLSDMCSLPDGQLLLLEREVSMPKSIKNGIFPIVSRIYIATLPQDKEPFSRKLIWQYRSIYNFEAICPGPILDNGSPTFLIFADGGINNLPNAIGLVYP